jgi:hypothetical protein
MSITKEEAERLAMILNRLDMDRNATAIRLLAQERDHLEKTAMQAAQRHEAAMARADRLEAENARLRKAIDMAIDCIQDKDVIGARLTLTLPLGETQ